MKLSFAREQYKDYDFDKQKLLKRIEEMMSDYTDRFNSYDPEDQARRIQKARTNFKLNGVVDYSHLSEQEQEELYKKSRILNEAFLDADYEVRGNDFFAVLVWTWSRRRSMATHWIEQIFNDRLLGRHRHFGSEIKRTNH